MMSDVGHDRNTRAGGGAGGAVENEIKIEIMVAVALDQTGGAIVETVVQPREEHRGNDAAGRKNPGVVGSLLRHVELLGDRNVGVVGKEVRDVGNAVLLDLWRVLVRRLIFCVGEEWGVWRGRSSW